MEKVHLSPPWITLCHKIVALFGGDPEITVDYDNEQYIIQLHVSNQRKAEALIQLLQPEYTFGNITVRVEVIAETEENADVIALLDTAFDGNPAFAFTWKADVDGVPPIRYCVFRNKVVQFFNDNLADVHGNCSMLYQDIADEVFNNHDGVYFCTDTEDAVGAPLGEWP